MFCLHKWKVVVDKVIETIPKEQRSNLESFPASFVFEKSITIVQCEYCGKIKKFVEEV